MKIFEGAEKTLMTCETEVCWIRGRKQMAKVIYRNEFERLARIIGQDDQDVRKIRFAVERNPGFSDSGLRLLDGLARLKNMDPSRTEAFYKHVEPEEIGGPIVFGMEKFHGYAVGLYEKELGESMFISGRRGVFKTALLEVIIPQWVHLGNSVLVISQKRDFLGLPDVIPDCCVMDFLLDFRFNLLEPSCAEAANRHAQVVANAARKNFGSMLSGEASMYVAIDELYRRFGVYEGGQEFPTMVDVLEWERSRYVAPHTEAARAKERLLKRVDMICRSLGPTIDVSQGITIADLVEHNVVLLVDRINPEVRDFVVEIILASMFTYRIERGERI